MRPRLACLLLGALLAAGPARGQVNEGGWYTHAFAEVSVPVSVTYGPDGVLYVGQGYDLETNTHGRIYAFVDSDGNGLPDSSFVFADPTPKWPLGLLVHDGWVYHTSRGAVIRRKDTDGDRVADVVDTVRAGLPWGKSQTNGLVLGPDNRLYVCQGAENNRGVQTDTLSATIFRMDLDGSNPEIFASGIRNPYDLAFHANGDLFAFDNGPDPDTTLDCVDPPDELNWIRQGHEYGFPDCFGIGDCAIAPPECTPYCGVGDCAVGGTCDPGVTLPLLALAPHVSANGLVFGGGVRDHDANDLFFVEFGSFTTTTCFPGGGRRLAKVRLTPGAGTWSPGAVEDVVGFPSGSPVDVVAGPDSALYVADFSGGKVWRVLRTRPTGIGDGEPAPLRPRLVAAPNPARDRVALRLDPAPAPGPMRTARVFDVAGREIRRLESTDGVWTWDLRDAHGRRVAGGIYLARATGEAGAVTARILVPSR